MFCTPFVLEFVALRPNQTKAKSQFLNLKPLPMAYLENLAGSAGGASPETRCLGCTLRCFEGFQGEGLGEVLAM